MVPGLVAAATAGSIGASVWIVIVALILYVVSWAVHGRTRLSALLLAPLVIAIGVPLHTVADPRAPVWLATALLAVTPLFLHLGAALPWRAIPTYVILAFALVAAVSLLPWSVAFFGSDIATRAQVFLLAAAALVVHSLAPYAGTRRPYE